MSQTNRKPDHIAGKLSKGKKWNPTLKQWETAKFVKLQFYQLDENNEPKIVGTWKNQEGQEFPSYNIIAEYRVASSSLLKVMKNESASCQIYLSEKPQSQAQKIRELEAKLAKLESGA